MDSGQDQQYQIQENKVPESQEKELKFEEETKEESKTNATKTVKIDAPPVSKRDKLLNDLFQNERINKIVEYYQKLESKDRFVNLNIPWQILEGKVWRQLDDITCIVLEIGYQLFVQQHAEAL